MFQNIVSKVKSVDPQLLKKIAVGVGAAVGVIAAAAVYYVATNKNEEYEETEETEMLEA